MFRLRPIFVPIVTLILAALGGALATFVGMPAGWLTGAVVTVAAVSLVGLNTRLPVRLFECAMVVLGIALGASITPDIVGRAGSWPISVAILLVSVAAIQLGVQMFLQRVCGWDPHSAFFAGLPGALSYVVALAATTRANLVKVTTAQSMRIFFLMTALPPLIVATGDVQGASIEAIPDEPYRVALAVVAGIAGAVLFRLMRFPAALLIGSLFGSGLLHATGVVRDNLPYPVIVVGFVVLGAFAGSRFVRADWQTLRFVALASAGAFLVAMVIAVAFAAVASGLTGVELSQAILAFAPGGISIMMSLAIALNLDSAFVAVHQLARFLLIALLAPLVSRWVTGTVVGSDPDES